VRGNAFPQLRFWSPADDRIDKSITNSVNEGEHRFSDLFRAINGPTQKMLTQQLRELERDGLVHRQVYAQVPPKVEYSLTPLGMSLKPVVNAMCDWGKKHQEETESRIAGSAPVATAKVNSAKKAAIVQPLRQAAS